MEAYGIGQAANSLRMLERVVALRITTDAMVNHADSDSAQQELMLDGRLVLARLLQVLMGK